MRYTERRSTIRNMSLLGLLVSLFSFLFLAINQQKSMDVGQNLDSLKNKKKIITLDNWNLKLLRCENLYRTNETCETLTPEDLSVTLPGTKTLSRIHSGLERKPNIALISRVLSDSELEWLDKQPLSKSTLIFPYMSHLATQLVLPFQPDLFLGDRADIRIPLTKDMIGKDRIELKLLINEKASWFGPAILPPALVHPNAERDFLDLSVKYQFGSQMNRLLEVIVPLLFAAMALILDHSPSASYLSLFAATRAARSSLSFLWENGNTNSLDPLIFWMHGLQVSFFILFLLSLAKICLKPKEKIVLIAGFSLLGLGNFLLGVNLISSDLIWDALLGIVGIVYCLMTFTSSQNKSKLQLIVVMLIILPFLYTNLEQLFELDQTPFKDFLDWKNQILVPGLVFASFIEIGSVYNTIQFVSKAVKEKTALDKEIEISRQIQRATLPHTKHVGRDWVWHAIYRPASKLAGDWYDIREIQITDQQSIFLAAVIDVTGHGISAALLTSNVASHWAIWAKAIPDHRDDLQSYLALAPQRIHEGLTGLRKNLGCSVAACILVPDTSELFYITAGHPGIITGSDYKFRYHSTEGSRPGSPNLTEPWEARKTIVEPEENTLALYSDGIVPSNYGVTQWLGRLRTDLKAKDKTFLSKIVRQFVANSRIFRKNQEIEDDLTLVILRRKKPY